jgi:hypothetical protein
MYPTNDEQCEDELGARSADVMLHVLNEAYPD